VRVEEVIGKRVKAAREAEGLSQHDLGRRLAPLLGRPWSRQSVSAAEQGQRAFTAVELVALAQALHVSVAMLVSPPGTVAKIELPGGASLDRREFLEQMDYLVGRLADERYGGLKAVSERLSDVAAMLADLYDAAESARLAQAVERGTTDRAARDEEATP
jgi:transcriptional regulator with XRE-family HTH domain